MIFNRKIFNPGFLALIFFTVSIFQPVYSETKTTKKPKKQEFDVLKPGKMANKTYKVKEDDNYYNIAKKYNLDYKKLMEINNAETPYTTIGHTIILTKETEPGNKYNGIIINIPEQKLYFFYKGNLSKIYKVSVGRPEDKWKTPVGNYKILFKDKAPTWHIPLSIQNEMKARGLPVKTEVKPGVNNPLGNWFMGINNSGLGIHSTNAPSSIGYSVTHSCIRMNPKSAAELFNLVKINTPVKIIYQPIKLDIDNKKQVYLEVFKNVYGNNLKTVSITKTLLKKYKVNEKDIDWKKVEKVAVDKKGIQCLSVQNFDFNIINVINMSSKIQLQILLAEDNPDEILLMQINFKDLNMPFHKLHIVTDGVHALDFLGQKGIYQQMPRPDFILLDIQMPRIDGLQVLETIKNDLLLRDIPVFLMFGSASQMSYVNTEKYQATFNIEKPVNTEKFMQLAKRFLPLVRIS